MRQLFLRINYLLDVAASSGKYEVGGMCGQPARTSNRLSCRRKRGAHGAGGGRPFSSLFLS